MFERFTEKLGHRRCRIERDCDLAEQDCAVAYESREVTDEARGVTLFARYEASQLGSPTMEPEHLLLGILREDKALGFRFLSSHAVFEVIREQMVAHASVREKVSTLVDLPHEH
jgi:hypothetical protein